MDYGAIVEKGEDHYQHTDSYQGLNVKEKIEEPQKDVKPCICELMPKL